MKKIYKNSIVTFGQSFFSLSKRGKVEVQLIACKTDKQIKGEKRKLWLNFICKEIEMELFFPAALQSKSKGLSQTN